MALLVLMFLEDSRVEQRVCLIFKRTCRPDSLFRRFTLQKTGESNVTLPILMAGGQVVYFVFVVLVIPKLVSFL